MPTYSYACTSCDNRFDIVQSFTDDALTECNECSGKLRKLFNSVGIVFKGSGFYRTDSRESGKSSIPSGGSGAADSSGSSGSSGASGSSGSSDKSRSSEKSSTSSSAAPPPTATPS